MNINEDFLNELGLSAMKPAEKKSFLDYVYAEIELRVGDELSKNMTPEQMVEFKKISDKDSSFIVNWLSAFVPMYHSDEVFENMQKIGNYDDVTDTRLLADYAASKWLELNCPNYNQTIEKVIKDLHQEISTNKDKLLK